MVCQRCGGSVETYELGGRDALVCRECGYLDTPVRHEPETTPSESWPEAIERFMEKFASTNGSEPGSVSDDDGDLDADGVPAGDGDVSGSVADDPGAADD